MNYRIVGDLGLAVLLSLWLAVPTWADLSCDGIDDILTTGLPMSSFVQGTDGTLMAWAKPEGTPPIVGECYQGANFASDADGRLSLGRIDPNTWCGHFIDNVAASEIVTTVTQAGWQHLALTWAASVLRLYKDGVLVDSEPLTGGQLEQLTGLIRLCAGLEGYSSARITEVEYHVVALSAPVIAVVAQSRVRGMASTAPSARWPLQDCPDGASGGAVTFRDVSGNSRHATGSTGGNATGLTCHSSEHLTSAWGVE